jgi:HD superfamily phosphohydrolase
MAVVPNPLSPGRIRDPVHGYIAFTAIERALLVHPIAQRLRYVGQSAAAHLVFPMETTVLPQGVSAAEAFLVARFRMYAWAVYHHKIQQAAAGLRVAIGDLLATAAPRCRRS